MAFNNLSYVCSESLSLRIMASWDSKLPEKTVTGRWKKQWRGYGRKIEWEMQERVTGICNKQWLEDGRKIDREMEETMTGKW